MWVLWCLNIFEQVKSGLSTLHPLVLIAQHLQQYFKISAYRNISRFQFRDLSAGMDYRGMVASTEGVADFRVAQLGEFLGQRHCDLPRPSDITRSLLPADRPPA